MKSNIIWLCECGESTEPEHPSDVVEFISHCEENGHWAHKVDKESGELIGFVAFGLSERRYGSNIPDRAMLRRTTSEPQFEHKHFGDEVY